MRRNSVFARGRAGRRADLDRRAVRQVGRRRRARRDRRPGATYLDSTGEPVVHPPRVRGDRRRRPSAPGAALLTGDGLRLRARRAGGRAGAARGRAGRGARRRRLLLARRWAPTAPAPGRASRWSAPRSTTTTRSATARVRHGAPGRARAHVPGQGQGAQRRSPSAAPSTTRCRRVYPTLLEVNVYLGWFGPLAKPLQAGALAGTVALKLPGVRSVLQAAGERLVSLAGAPEAGTTPGDAVLDPRRSPTTRPASRSPRSTSPAPTPTTSRPPSSPGPPSAPPGGNRPHAVGAVGPVEAFGLDALEQGCAAAGLRSLSADAAAA